MHRVKAVAIIQARMTSTRLPGKVLADLVGAPMLERQIARLRRSSVLADVALATTTNETDDAVAALGHRLGLSVFRGSEHDVLARYAGAVALVQPDVVVRVTADCPLIAPEVIDTVVQTLISDASDYASNVASRTFPRGLDVEAMTRSAFERCERLATSAPAREHVTWFIHTERPDLFTRSSVTSDVDASDLRWTVDTPEDLEVVRAIYEGLDLARREAPYSEILDWVRSRPEISRINAAVEQKHS